MDHVAASPLPEIGANMGISTANAKLEVRLSDCWHGAQQGVEETPRLVDLRCGFGVMVACANSGRRQKFSFLGGIRF